MRASSDSVIVDTNANRRQQKFAAKNFNYRISQFSAVAVVQLRRRRRR